MEYERWLSSAGLDGYLPQFDAMGYSSIDAIASLQPGQIDQVRVRPLYDLLFQKLCGK